MVAKYSQQQVDFMIVMQDTVDHAHKRRLDEKVVETNLALKDGVMGQLMAALPILLNRLAGNKIVDEPDKSFMLLGTFLENLSPEQQSFLQTSLKGPQQAILGEILREYEQKKDAYLNSQNNKSITKRFHNELPPPSAPITTPPTTNPTPGAPGAKPGNSPKQLVQVDPADKPPRPVPLFQGLKERLASPDGITLSDPDPQLQRYEEGVKNFAARFKDMLGSKPKPTGEE
jgi:hypothetical protein